MINDPSTDPEKVRYWIKLLDAGDETVCRQAMRQLEQQGVSAVPALLKALQREEWRKVGWKFITALDAIYLFCILIDTLTKPGLRGDPLAWLYLFGFCMITDALYKRATRALPRQQRIMQLLARLENMEAVSALLEALSIGNRQDWYIHQVIRASLTRLLPGLKASDAPRLTDTHRNALHRELQGEDASLLLAILQALEQIGDGRSLAPVEKLIQRCQALVTSEDRSRVDLRLFRRRTMMLPAEQHEVLAAAQTCLEVLHIHAVHRQSGQTLLRPAAREAAAPEELVRPAQSAAQTPPEQLLRPK